MSKDIAIIGMAGRFPDAVNLDGLFVNLAEGKDSVREISRQRLESTTLPLDKEYRLCGYLEDVDKFDFHFFNISLAEAQTMEPNQRVLLEVAYEIFENAAYGIDAFDGSNTCVYVAEAGNDYYKHADKILPTLITGNAREFLAARLARQFNLRGTAAMVNTSCSSALVAVHLACNELILKDADYALVCAVNIDLFPYNDNSLNLGLLSPDGKSRAFSARANGMSRGETAAGLLLKPLDKAITDKDIIHAVIKGAAVNNNAQSSASLSAPDSQTQAEVIKKAWEKAGINPLDIGFIEAHGSGTELGDSLEIEGLDLAFQSYTDKKGFCPISTIKSNVGHGVFASGMSGLIAAVLSLKHNVIFPTLHFDAPNPLIDFENSAVYVNDTLKKWEGEEGKSRIAGVSSIGFSGTNCHMILQEAPPAEAGEKNEGSHPGEKAYLITASSKTLEGLKENLGALHQKINSGNSYRLNDIAYTLNKGRMHYNYRFACIAGHLDGLKHQLADGVSGLAAREENPKPPPVLRKLIFIFSDHEEIPESLFHFFQSSYPLFEKYFQQCLERAGNQAGNFRHFAFQYSLYKLLESHGIITGNILAVGIGRITAAVISGAVTLEQAVDRVNCYEVEALTGLEQRVKSLIENETGDQPTAFIDLGPGGVISRELENQDTGDHKFYVFRLDREPAAVDPWLELLKSLYLANYAIDRDIFFENHEGRKLELPGYRFRKARCWLREEPAAITGDAGPAFPTSYLLDDTGSEIEEKIAGYWREVLKVEKFYLEDNFFEKGGDSLKATRVINRINQTFMLELDFEDIFDFPTIGALAEYIDSLLGTRQKMALLWKEVLKVQQVESEDHFFELGGHSLLATQVLNRIKKEYHLELNFEEFFQHPTLLSICQYIDKMLAEGKNNIEYSSIEPVEKKEYHPLSSAQKRLYLLQYMEKENIGYNGCEVFAMEGELLGDRLEATFKKLIGRHESFRTCFEFVGEEPVQRVHDEVVFEIEYYDLATGDTESTESRGGSLCPPLVKEKVIKDFIRPFDLSAAPLLRVGLIKTGGQEHVLMVDIHHIITDGTSMALLVRDFLTLYEGHLLPDFRIQYKDFTQWQNNEKKRALIKQQEAFWLKEFAGEIPALNLPTDYPRPRVQGFAGSSLLFEIGKKETAAFKELARNENITLFMLLLAVYNVLLSKLCGQDDIVVGSPLAGRRHEDLQPIIGMFVNTLALRNDPRGDKLFNAFLKEIKEKTLKAFENQDYPFEDLVDQVVVERDVSRNPLFDTLLVLQNMETEEILIPGLKLKPYAFDAGVSHFDLVFVAREAEEQLSFYMEYSTRLFKKITVERLIRYFKNLISSIPVDPHRQISVIPFIGEEEKQQVLVDFNNTEAGFPVERTIHQWFREQVEKTPYRIALIGTKLQNTNYKQNCIISVTYKELNNKSNQLARLLVQGGVKPGVIVGIMAGRSIEMIIGIMGILKAGGAYLPIDVEDPRERIDYMLVDSAASILLTTRDLVEKYERFGNWLGHVFYLDEAGTDNELNKSTGPGPVTPSYRGPGAPPAVTAIDPVYIIYTSGSTGKPKGVILQHRNLVNLLEFQHRYTNIDSSKILQFATISFDASFHEIFTAFLSGGQLVLVDKETRLKIPLLFDVIAKNVIKTVFLPISFLKIIFSDTGYVKQIPGCIDHIQTAGEQVVVSDEFKRYLKERGVYLHNHYGPSETHVVTTYTIDPAGDIPGLPPIGRPVSNTLIYILDRGMQLVPVGIPGELFIGGIQVGTGYLNRPELTAERFITAQGRKQEAAKTARSAIRSFDQTFSKGWPPAGPPEAYRTGDLGRWQPDGNIEFLGRIDHQVKIRGFRIELGEIETQLLKHELIKETVVTAREERGERYLCAYFVTVVSGKTKASVSSGVREFLSKCLPAYMIPSCFVPMVRFPLTPSGKIDRDALPDPELKREEKSTPPRDEMEKHMVKIWAELLHLEENVIGIDTNFFSLGGHSLKATILSNKIKQVFQVEIALTEFFKQPTVRELTKYIKGAVKVSFISIEPVEKKEYYGLSSAQKRLYILQQTQPASIAYNIPGIFTLAGEVGERELEGMFREMIKRHESLRTSFHMISEEPFQRIHDEVEFKIEYNDFQVTGAGDTCRWEETPFGQIDAFGGGEREPATGNWQLAASTIKNFIRPFDLSRAPLVRVGLIKLLHTPTALSGHPRRGTYTSQEGREDKYLLIVDMHHIISDGASIGISIKEFMQLYENEPLSPLKVQYKDCSEWQHSGRTKELISQQEQYWLREFESEPPVLNLRTDYLRPVIQSVEGNSISFEIGNQQLNALKTLVLKEEVTLYILFLAAFTLLLSKLSGQEDIIIGTPSRGRQHSDLEGVLGMFVNILAIRNFPGGEKTLRRFLKEVKDKSFAIFENQDYQFENLVSQIEFNRDTSRNPLFDVMFVLNNEEIPKIEIPGLKLEPYQYNPQTSKFDLALSGIESEDKLVFTFEYCTRLFKKETIRRFTVYFLEIVSSMVGNLDRRLSEVEIIPGEEKQRLLVDFNDRAPFCSNEKNLRRLFAEQVKKTPDHIVLDYEDGQVAYNRLHKNVKQLAKILRGL